MNIFPVQKKGWCEQNMEKANLFTLFLGTTGGLVGFLTGGFDMGLKVLLAVMVIDYVSGLAASAVEGKLSSKIGFRGIPKKVLIVCMVSLGHLVDVALDNGSGLFRDAVIFFYFANEVLSVVENAGRIGLPVPDKLIQAVEVLKNKKGE